MKCTPTVFFRRVALCLSFALFTQTSAWSQSSWERRATAPPDVVVPLGLGVDGEILPYSRYGLDTFQGGTFGHAESGFLMHGKTRLIYSEFLSETPLASMTIQGSEISQVALSPDDELLLVGDEAGRVRVYFLETGYKFLEHRGHDAPITALSFAPDGAGFATADRDGAFHIWRFRDGPTPIVSGNHGDTVSILSYSGSGDLLLVGGRSSSLQVLKTDDGESVQRLTEGASFLITAEITPDETEIITAHRRNPTYRVWDLETGTLKRELPTFNAARNAFLVPTLNQSATVETTGKISLYSLDSGRRLNKRGYGNATFASLSPSGEFLFRQDGALGEIYSLETSQRTTLLPSGAAISSLAVSPDGSQITAASRGRFRMLDRHTGQVLQSAPLTLRRAEYSEDGRLVYDRFFGVSGFVLGSDVEIIFGRDHLGASLLNGRQLFLRAPGDTVTVNVLEGTQRRHVSTLENSRVSNVHYAISPDQSQIASLSQRVIRIWDSESGEMTREIRTEPETHRLHFLPGIDRLVTINNFHGITVWNLAGDAEPVFLGPVESDIGAFDASSDGRLFAIGHADGSLRVVDWQTGNELAGFAGHAAVVTAVRFTPDGQWLVSGDFDGLVQLWPLETSVPEPLQVSREQGDSLRLAIESPSTEQPITWYRDNEPIAKGDNSLDELLEFETLSVSDSGIYVARSDLPNDSTESLALALTVLRPGDIPQTYDEWVEQFPWGERSTDPGSDADADQRSNLEEYLIGSHPLENNAGPRLIAMERQDDGAISLTVHLAPHARSNQIALETGTQLGTWAGFNPEFEIEVQADGSEIRRTHLSPDDQQRFYRWMPINERP